MQAVDVITLLLPIEILQVRTSSLADHIPYWLQAGEKNRYEGLVNACWAKEHVKRTWEEQEPDLYQ